MATSLFNLYGWYKSLRYKRMRGTPRSLLRANKSAVIFGLIWAGIPVFFVFGGPQDQQFMFSAVCMASIGAGAFALSRVPSAAVLYTGIVAGALVSVCLIAGTAAGLAMAAITVLYAVALIGMVQLMHLSSLERKMDKIRLDRQKEIISLLLKDFEAGTSDWLWETDGKGRLKYVSDRLCEVLGRGRSRLEGATLLQAARMDAGSPGWRELEQRMHEGKGFKDIEVEVALEDRQMWWQLSARPLVDETGKCIGFRGVCSDITGRRKAKQELIAARDEAEAASAAKSRFLSIMSHELRSPLSAISGFADLIADQREGPVNIANYVEYAKNIQQSSQHLTVLINDILDLSRIENGKINLIEQEIDPVELFSVVARMCKAQAPDSGVAIVEKFHHGQYLIYGDLTRLKQILLNIGGNAVKFTPPGGEVVLELGLSGDGGMEMIVSDNGPGIAEEDLEHIFEPFMQADQNSTRAFDGLGLGLAIALRLARLHNGDLSVTSASGKGTRVVFSLPRERVLKACPAMQKEPVEAA
ncbi:MAG TPA: PAS domain-containing sensor histidine kinase [Rhizobiales bacterium]|nr:PAS domain-containing sensor histidine kinase [Hyphomicrobiales bacterium]